MPPKQLHRTSPAPPACPTFPPYSAPLQPPVFGWLFCVVCVVVDLQSSKVTMYYIYISFLSFHSPPQSMGQYLPTRSPPTRLRYNTPPTASANYQVDCCFSSPNGGDLRPEPGPSLYFFCSSYSFTSINRTGNSKSTPDILHLIQTHREWWCQDLEPWRMLPCQ